MNYELLGQRIRDYRKQMHKTQEQLAETANISLSFLGHIERGSRKASLETIVAVSNSLGISPHFLLQDSLSDAVRGIPTGKNEAQTQALREISEVFDKYWTIDE